ncbi:MAG: glycosyl hydrolase family 92, partial [Bacteroidetes bacterium HGW-Bacteroidetes-21]
MKFSILAFLSFVLLISCSEEKTRDYTYLVNPLVGTGGHGHTYPGVCLPFGMMQVSPDTRLEGWDGCSGYHYSDSIIFGFSHTHLSGTGCSDYGDILLMPTTGPARCFNGYPDKVSEGYASSFSHETEVSTPGYYAVVLDNYQIKAELTATQRAAMHKYSYPENAQKNIIVDLAHRDEVIESELKIINQNTLEGYRRSKAWATDQIIYYHIEFSEPIIQSGIFVNDTIQTGKDIKGKNLIAYFSFNPNSNEPILVKIGISQTSIEGAKLNLSKEITCNDFDKYVKNAQNTWNKTLSKVDAYGDSTTLANFYTALYHSYLAPNLANDYDGRYRGMDKKNHTANHNYYTVFSLWDTYRALHPLMSILEPEESNNFVKTFLLMYKQGGLLPVWELSSNETFCMIGYHAVSVIYDLFQKGINDYDKKLAFEAMKNSAMQDHYGLSSLKNNGY